MTNFYDNIGQTQGPSNIQVPYQVPTHRDIAFPTNGVNSTTSSISVHDTISNLSSTISSMQQQQAFLANALGNLTSVIQDMRNNLQSQPVGTHSAVYETVGNFSTVRSDSMHQVRPSSTSRPQTDLARYENNEYQASGQQRLYDNMANRHRQDGSGDQLQSLRSNEVQQQGHTENRPLSNPTRNRQSVQNWQLSNGPEETEQQGWTENRPLANATTERRNCYRESMYLQPSISTDEIHQQGWTENRPLANATTEGRHCHRETRYSQPTTSSDETQQQEWIENRPLANATTEGQNCYRQSSNLQPSFPANEIQQQRGSENYPLSNPRREWQNRRQQQRVSQPNNAGFPDFKLPPFNGKEDWKVWLNRFEAVATRKHWSDDDKLDNLLPRLQGRAGDFVYTQLNKQTISSYPELIKELNSRFRVVETQKTFAAKFSQRTQKPSETVEEYAAELKRLYSKAYKSRDSTTRQEDLVRRFLDGLKDSDASFEIEFHKEPDDIDEAVFHAVNFIQTKRRSQTDSYQDRKSKRYARRASPESDQENDSEIENDEDDRNSPAIEHIMRLPNKEEQQKLRYQKSEQKKDTAALQLESITEVKKMLETLAGKVDEMQKGSPTPSDQKQNVMSADNSGITCYACGEKGHISRRCPKRQGDQRPRDNRTQAYQGRLEGQRRNRNPLN
ncbi:MAG: hypothetical protein N0E59_18855 [Candidatus Thiodiazotropha taylori]|nr:hypothetical protein [Candidatus Thiodiazotropha taylori]MCW4285179.1 hypothetical protein [Candidatus Thiodiazotropha taylori]